MVVLHKIFPLIAFILIFLFFSALGPTLLFIHKYIKRRIIDAKERLIQTTTSEKILRKYSKSKTPRLQKAVANNLTTPSYILDNLLKKQLLTTDTLYDILKNPNLSPERIEFYTIKYLKLISHYFEVRYPLECIAGNKNTPTKLLFNLVNTIDQKINKAALNNLKERLPKLTIEERERVFVILFNEN